MSFWEFHQLRDCKMRYECINCGYQTASWFGRCPECGEWNSLKSIARFEDKKKAASPAQPAKIISAQKIKIDEKKRIKTDISEFDRVLSGGIVRGAVILFTGDPGIGKSTLLLQIAEKIPSFYISAEESLDFIAQRIKRLGIKPDKILLTEEKILENLLHSIPENIDLIIVDSIQTIFSQEIDSPPGSILQIKMILDKFIQFAKSKGKAVIFVGHKTKSGEYAGPKTLEHMVDVVLNLQGDFQQEYRILSSSKNRFGSTTEIGMFRMTDKGLQENFDPLIFIDDPEHEKIGRAFTAEKKGQRILFYEIQSLVVPSFLAIPRRVAKGIDQKKLLLLTAVMKKYLRLSLDKYDIYISTTGGVRINSSYADLAIIVSLLSSLKNKPSPAKTLFLGEVDLLGKIRKTPAIESMKKNLNRYGFKKIIDQEKISMIKEIEQFFLQKQKK